MVFCCACTQSQDVRLSMYSMIQDYVHMYVFLCASVRSRDRVNWRYKMMENTWEKLWLIYMCVYESVSLTWQTCY